MADTHKKILGNVQLDDGFGLSLTSTVVGAKRALDVNVTGGEITIENATILVDIDAFTATPDSVLCVGSEDATQLGTRHVMKVSATGQVNVLGPLTDAELRATPVPVSGTVNNIVVEKSTYAASGIFTLAANATDAFAITGSGTKTIRIHSISINGTNSGNTNAVFAITKRSAANTGGTSTTLANVPLDSTNAAATATVRSYTANPTTGAAVGDMRYAIVFFPVLASTNVGNRTALHFGVENTQEIVLRGTSEVASVNFRGVAIAGTTVLAVDIIWTEE